MSSSKSEHFINESRQGYLDLLYKEAKNLISQGFQAKKVKDRLLHYGFNEHDIDTVLKDKI